MTVSSILIISVSMAMLIVASLYACLIPFTDGI